jgi:zinc transporter ZupT
MPEDQQKRRNYIIAGSVGGFLLPIAGLVGALVFASAGDRAAAQIVGLASLAGALLYLVVFAL